MKILTAKTISKRLWEADGKPDGRGVGEANRSTYHTEALRVMAMIRKLGFRVVRRY